MRSISETAVIQCVIHTLYYYEDPRLASGLDVQLILLHHYPHAARLIDKQHKSTKRDKHFQRSKDPDANLYRTEGKLGVLPIVGMLTWNTTPEKTSRGSRNAILLADTRVARQQLLKPPPLP